MSLTLVSAFYLLHSKFSSQQYEQWFANFLPHITKCNLIIFCDEKSKPLLEKYIQSKDNIMLVILPIEKFYNYRYRQNWINNHHKNYLLNHQSKFQTDWKLNMLWSEKISFVQNAFGNKYFPETDWYAWCDIGYFRSRHKDITSKQLQDWPNKQSIEHFNSTKIYYALINNNMNYIHKLIQLISRKNLAGLPSTPIPPRQESIAGGFFLIHKGNIDWWHTTYDSMLTLYFKNNYLVKDDQMIIFNCICDHKEKFQLCRENNPQYDIWFMFQRLLL